MNNRSSYPAGERRSSALAPAPGPVAAAVDTFGVWRIHHPRPQALSVRGMDVAGHLATAGLFQLRNIVLDRLQT
jgi:hypothetical protein